MKHEWEMKTFEGSLPSNFAILQPVKLDGSFCRLCLCIWAEENVMWGSTYGIYT